VRHKIAKVIRCNSILCNGEPKVSDTGPRFVSVQRACEIIGGDRPIHYATYYRGVKSGIFPAPQRVSPGIARVNLDKLTAALTDPNDKDVA
jgi:hypothetical protein